MPAKTTTENAPPPFNPRHDGFDEWAARHNRAVSLPNAGGERLAVNLYQTAHHAAMFLNGDGYGTPEVAVPAIEAARAFLNFDIGRLDAGTIDGHLCALADHIGWNLDAGTWA